MSKFIINDNVWSDADLNSAIPIEAPEVSFLFDRYDYRRIKQKYAQRLDTFSRAIIGSKNTKFNNAILISESEPINLNGSVVTFIREYVEMPETTEEIIPISYTYPSIWTPYRYQQGTDDDGNPTIKEVKSNLVRQSFTTTTSALVVYEYFLSPPENKDSLYPSDNLAEFLKVSTSRKMPTAGATTLRGINSFTVDYIDGSTNPPHYYYINSAIENSERYTFRAFDTVIEKWIANIYRTKDVFVQYR